MFFRKLTFKGGVHPPEYKKFVFKKPIEVLPRPEQVILPVLQHNNAPAEPTVRVGDHVQIGDVVWQTPGNVSSFTHASVSGTVSAIENRPHPQGGHARAIVITNDGADTLAPSIAPVHNYMAQDIAVMRGKIQQSGLAAVSDAVSSAAERRSQSPNKNALTFILNGIESEPFLTAGHRLLLERPNEILEGVRILMKLSGCKTGYIALEKNKSDAIALMQRMIRESGDQVSIVRLNVKYPQSAEKQLIKAITNRYVPSGGSPMDVGCLVFNVATVKAVYDAVSSSKPLYERVITVTGKGVSEPKNVLVRLGTPIQNLIDFCGGLTKDAAAVIHGGPMMGIAQSTLDVPVINATSGIVVLTKKEVKIRTEGPCIRCARCVDTCPMNLMPNALAQLVKFDRLEEAHRMGLMDCIECGACSFVCPANIPHVLLFQAGKRTAANILNSNPKAA
ncbi:MAG: electron transport complex subunit RsxC [Candidatus Zhuqueibacterota bacterium]